jgi:CheY-like chemotaxis protein
MSAEVRSTSSVREELPFPTPPRVRVVADDDRIPEAMALAEALDMCGADSEVRLSEDALGGNYDHVYPDAIVIDLGMPPQALTNRQRAENDSPILIAVTDRDGRVERREARAAGFDLVIVRPVDPSVLMEMLGQYVFGART